MENQTPYILPYFLTHYSPDLQAPPDPGFFWLLLAIPHLSLPSPTSFARVTNKPRLGRWDTVSPFRLFRRLPRKNMRDNDTEVSAHYRIRTKLSHHVYICQALIQPSMFSHILQHFVYEAKIAARCLGMHKKLCLLKSAYRKLLAFKLIQIRLPK